MMEKLEIDGDGNKISSILLSYLSKKKMILSYSLSFI